MNERDLTDLSSPMLDFDPAQLSRNEYITSLVHFYRGEMYRSTAWRLRLDTTTNWSIFSVTALLTFSLGDASHSHVGILTGMVLVLTFLAIEARRYRFFDVWRRRTRILEENFIVPILRRNMNSPIENWGKLVAEDLLRPRLRVTFHEALRTRLIRNYVPLFLLLLVCWFLKLGSEVNNETNPVNSYWEAMRIGQLTPWITVGFVGTIYLYIVGVLALVRRRNSPDDELWPRSQGELCSIDF